MARVVASCVTGRDSALGSGLLPTHSVMVGWGEMANYSETADVHPFTYLALSSSAQPGSIANMDAIGQKPSGRGRRHDHILFGGRAGGSSPRQGGVDGRCQPLHLLPLLPLLALLELGHDLLREQLQGLADVLVPVAAGLAYEDDLVDAHCFVAPQELTDLVRGTDGPSQRPEPLLHESGSQCLTLPGRNAPVEPELPTPLLELLPDVRLARCVPAVHIVVAQRVAEEVPAVEASLDGGALVLMTHERGHDRHLGIDGEAGRDALL